MQRNPPGHQQTQGDREEERHAHDKLHRGDGCTPGIGEGEEGICLPRRRGLHSLPVAILSGASVLLALATAWSAQHLRGAGNLEVSTIEALSGEPGLAPSLSTDATGRVCLSWIVEAEDEAILRFARTTQSGFEAPRDALRGTEWFVNWADVPSLVGLGDATWLVHFLRQSGTNAYDYQVLLARSVDGGRSFGEPFRLHDDPGAGEHGFVSLLPTGSGEAVAVWLDGRGMIGGHGEEGEGATALYLRTIGRSGALGPERRIDERVCDCCPTSAVALEDGTLLLAYRDRDSSEVRDISLVRAGIDGSIRSTWSSGDGWKIQGCPVNGPALARAGKHVGLAWFTLGGDGRARVLAAVSDDQGANWSSPLELAGARSHGRVALCFDRAGRMLVTWLESDGDAAWWKIARILGGRVLDTNAVVASEGARKSGIARVAPEGEGAIFAWTQTEGEPTIGVVSLRWR